jgi:ubiquinone biosynthesis protein
MLSIRKIGVFGRTYRHLNRYRQILGILFKHGFGDLIERLKIEQYIEVGLQLISKKRREPGEKLSRAERVRMAFEELGPTYIKLGQALSTRPDLIPFEFVRELSKLQDDVPAFPFPQAAAIIEKELGGAPGDLFENIEERPIASGSIGQVYKAWLNEDEAVAVKVQRPGIRKIIEVDLEIMLHLATLIESHVEELSLHRPIKIVEEFADSLEKEIDYNIEAANMERFARQFLDTPTIYIPKVYREMTTSHILTAEFIDGIKVSRIDKLKEAGLDPKKLTENGANLLFKQIFDYGFFHADPHPGNIFALPNNVICLLDFGNAGMVDRTTREEFVDLIDSVVHRNEKRAMQVLIKLTSHDEEPDLRLFERDVADFMGRHLFKPLKEIELGRLLQNLMDLASRHQLRIRPDIFLMMKALATVEGVAMMMDPEFDMISKAAPFIERVKLARYYPDRILNDIFSLTSELMRFLEQFPTNLLEISRLVRQKKLQINVEHQGLDTLRATHDQISNRIAFSIIIAALIIGSALIVISETPPIIYGISLIGMIGFLAAAIMGIWLLVAILKKGKL